ncbi:MAG: class I SAM-dependent methyltransferase [Propionibacteriaceae bacterium]
MTARLHDHLNHLHSRLRESQLAMFGLNRLPRVYELAFGWMGEPLYQRVAADAAQAEGLAPGDLVLDIGTGPGRVPRLLHQLRRDLLVEGIDVSAEMIEGARATADREEPVTSGSGALRYTVADVADLPYPDRSVALVVSSLSLHHWPDPEAGIAEIRRVLRPDGKAWLYDVNPQLATTLRHLESLGATAHIEPLTPRSAAGGKVRDHLVRKWIARLELN